MQHRRDQVHPARVVLDAPSCVELISADADVIDTDDVGHLLETLDVSVEAREKCQMPIEPPVSAMARAWSGLICRPVSGVGPIARDLASAVWDSSSGFVATLTACFAISSVACATSQTKPSRWQARITSAPNSVSP